MNAFNNIESRLNQTKEKLKADLETMKDQKENEATAYEREYRLYSTRLKPSYELKSRVKRRAKKLEAGEKTFGYNRTTTDHIIKRSRFK